MVVAVGVNVAVWVGSGVKVTVGVGVIVRVWVGSGVSVAVGVWVSVRFGVLVVVKVNYLSQQISDLCKCNQSSFELVKKTISDNHFGL